MSCIGPARPSLNCNFECWYAGRDRRGRSVPSDAFEKFRKSMAIGYMEWHDGIGYDMGALAELSGDELLEVEDMLVARRAPDWRDLEALDQIGSARALEKLQGALQSKSVELRIEAARRLAARGLLTDEALERIIVEALAKTTILDGMTRTLELAAAHPSPVVREKLLYCSLHGNDDIRVHAAALVHFLFGRSSSAFDWKFRPFYLRFGSRNRAERRAAYKELCSTIGVAPERE